jgi:hypothetical protein
MRSLLILLLLILCIGCPDTGECPDSEVAGTWYLDTDGDGHGELASAFTACEMPADASAVGDDCDDANAEAHPDADEVCDGVDNNCDGVVDEGLTTTYYADRDLDGFGDEGAPVEACEPTEGAPFRRAGRSTHRIV